MTLPQCVSVLRELRGLERLQASILRLSAPEFEWRCGLTAIDDRVRWNRYCLSIEDPALVARAGEVLQAEPAPESVFTATDWAAAWTEPN